MAPGDYTCSFIRGRLRIIKSLPTGCTRPSSAAARGTIKNIRVRKLQSWKKQAVSWVGTAKRHVDSSQLIALFGYAVNHGRCEGCEQDAIA